MRTLLNDTIASSSQERLRSVLYRIVATNPDAFDTACEVLLLPQGKLKQVTDQEAQNKTTFFLHRPLDEELTDEEYKAAISNSELSDEEPVEIRSNGVKRKLMYTRQRYEICGQCEQEYDTLDNKATSCIWHDGEALRLVHQH